MAFPSIKKAELIIINQLRYLWYNSIINNISKIANENNIKVIAFPCISTGEFRFPKKMAANIALNAVKEYLNKSDVSIDKVVFNVFSEEDYKIYAESMVDIYGRI